MNTSRRHYIAYSCGLLGYQDWKIPSKQSEENLWELPAPKVVSYPTSLSERLRLSQAGCGSQLGVTIIVNAYLKVMYTPVKPQCIFKSVHLRKNLLTFYPILLYNLFQFQSVEMINGKKKPSAFIWWLQILNLLTESRVIKGLVVVFGGDFCRTVWGACLSWICRDYFFSLFFPLGREAHRSENGVSIL